MNFSGMHLMAELYGVDAAVLDSETALSEILRDAIPRGGATLLRMQAVRFEPQGVTVAAILSESHATFHTYPERRSCFVDVFTCGDCDPGCICDHVIGQLRPTSFR